MKVRTSLLFVCMIVVPGLAMFSHRVPAEVRSATRCAIWEPIAAWTESWTATESEPAAGERSEERVAEVPPLVSSPDRSADHPWQNSTADGGVATAATPSPTAALAPAPDRRGPVSGRLASLGATAVECRPLDGVPGVQVASCRVAMDAAGQLHRVFQTTAATPDEAIAALAAEVERWRDRLATRSLPAAAETGTAGF